MFNWLRKLREPVTRAPETKPKTTLQKEPKSAEPEAVRFLKGLFAAHPDYELEVSPPGPLRGFEEASGIWRHIAFRFPMVELRVVSECMDNYWSCDIVGTTRDSAGVEKTLTLYKESFFKYSTKLSESPIFNFLSSHYRVFKLKSPEEEKREKIHKQEAAEEAKLKDSVKAQYLGN